MPAAGSRGGTEDRGRFSVPPCVSPPRTSSRAPAQVARRQIANCVIRGDRCRASARPCPPAPCRMTIGLAPPLSHPIRHAGNFRHVDFEHRSPLDLPTSISIRAAKSVRRRTSISSKRQSPPHPRVTAARACRSGSPRRQLCQHSNHHLMTQLRAPRPTPEPGRRVRLPGRPAISPVRRRNLPAPLGMRAIGSARSILEEGDDRPAGDGGSGWKSFPGNDIQSSVPWVARSYGATWTWCRATPRATPHRAYSGKQIGHHRREGGTCRPTGYAWAA